MGMGFPISIITCCMQALPDPGPKFSPCPCAGQLCGEDWQHIGEVCLRINSSRDSYDNAQHYCKNLGGNIASLITEKQVDFVLEELHKYHLQGKVGASLAFKHTRTLTHTHARTHARTRARARAQQHSNTQDCLESQKVCACSNRYVFVVCSYLLTALLTGLVFIFLLQFLP